MSIRKILVPLDGSPFCEHALPHAASIARRTGSRIILAYVQLPVTTFLSADNQSPLTPYEDVDVEESMQAYLDRTAASLRKMTGSQVSTSYRTGPVVDTLCEVMGSESVDLVAITTHGRGALSRFWMGSVATELIHRSPVPLLLTRPKESPSEWKADVEVSRILIPLDGSSFAEKAIPLALQFGNDVDTAKPTVFRLIQVIPPASVASGFKEAGHETDAATLSEELRLQADNYLHGLQSRMTALQQAETQIAVDWPASQAILSDAETHAIDYIVMTTHGRTGISRLFLGSVADKVIRGASTVPILLCRPK